MPLASFTTSSTSIPAKVKPLATSSAERLPKSTYFLTLFKLTNIVISLLIMLSYGIDGGISHHFDRTYGYHQSRILK